MSDDEPSRLERLCIEKGLKMTEQRRVVARVLSDSEDHSDVKQLYRRASKIDRHISIATVCRHRQAVRGGQHPGLNTCERRGWRQQPVEAGDRERLLLAKSCRGRVSSMPSQAQTNYTP